jgi:iron complex outermembrane receptor protein
MKKLLFLLAIFIFLFQGMLIYGEEPGETTFYLGEIVVRATKDEGDEKSRIESKTLKTHKVVDLAEILSDEMIEATMIRKGAYGNEVAIRGFGQSNLRVLIDDGLLEGACGSRKDPSLSHINMLTVDKIEVRQGPFDVTKAGALGGSINVATRKPQEGFKSEILGKGGSFGFGSGGAYVTGGNKFIQGLIGYNYSESDQYEDGGGNKLYRFAPGGRPYNAEGRDMKAFEKQDVWGKLQLTPNENQTILLEYTYGHAEDIMAPRVEMDMEDEKTYLSKGSYTITGLGELSDKLTFSVYRNRVEHNPYDKYRDLVGGPLFHRHLEVDSTITGGKVENEQATDFAGFTYGIDIYKRNWQGDMFRDDTGAIFDDEFIPDVDTYNYGVYVKADKNFKKWSINSGLRYDRFETKAHEDLKQCLAAGITTNKNTDDLPSGYISARYYLTDNSHIFGGVGRSVRTPTSAERYLQSPSPNFHGNPDLDPTKNTEFDLGFQTASKGLTFRMKAFYSDLDDYIYQQGKKTAISHQTWTNIDAHLYGADVRAILDIVPDFSVEIAAAYQKGKKDSQPDNNDDRDLAQIPPLKTKLALRYDHADFFGTLEWIHSEDADDIDDNAGEQKLDGWDVVNLRAGYNFKQLTFNFGIENIFDECYAVANSYEWDVVAGTGATPAVVYEPGRFFYASVSYKF